MPPTTARDDPPSRIPRSPSARAALPTLISAAACSAVLAVALGVAVLAGGLLVGPGPNRTVVAVRDATRPGAPTDLRPPVDDPGGRRYLAPVSGAVLRHRFRAPPQAWAPGHRGVDLEAEPGTPLLAPAAGTVSFSGPVVDRWVITIEHPDGRRSSLEPVTGALPAGATVAAGEVVASVGSEPGHCAPATCVHWGVREGTRYVDPLGLLPGAGPVVLLPLVDG